MKISVLTLLTASVLLSCHETKLNGPYNFSSSYQKWLEQKKDHNSSYRFSLVSSSWTGAHSSTTITVINDKITSRTYEAASRNDTGDLEVHASWTENEAELNTHEEGVDPILFDEIYSACHAKHLKLSSRKNTIYFYTDANGILSKCGHVPDNCADDCFFGFEVDFFEWL